MGIFRKFLLSIENGRKATQLNGVEESNGLDPEQVDKKRKLAEQDDKLKTQLNG